ncbi:MAG TPA: hypothetical protein VL727_29800 [Puia sp.]|jgi:hypothetical protein|nr:hypothetical protein [Puia sp.]
MKQVLFVAAGQEFPNGPFNFLRMMQQDERVHARALFFKPLDYAALSAVAANCGADLTPLLKLEEKEKEAIHLQKNLFARHCQENYISYTINENEQSWEKDLLVKESRFADLVLISGELFYASAEARQPNQYLQEALHAAECPVLIIPETFTTVEQLFMAYDGSKESIFALKEFCHLFPQLCDLPTEIVYVNEESGNTIPEIERLRQFTRLKFNSMNFAKLHFKASEYFAAWINEKRNVLLVSGSFGRAPFSYLMKRSFSEHVIHDHQLPLFIAHQ